MPDTTAHRIALIVVFLFATGVAAAPPAKPSGKVITTIAEIFDGLPAELLPDPKTGWTDVTREKVRLWMLQNGDNRPCRLVVPVESVRSVSRPDPRKPGRDLELTIQFKSELFIFHGVTLGVDIQVAPSTKNDEVIYQATEAESEAAQKLYKTRGSMAISGVIRSPRLGVGTSDKNATVEVKVLKAEIGFDPSGKSDGGGKPVAGKEVKPEPDKKPAADEKPFTAWPQLFIGLPADAAPVSGKGWEKDAFRNASLWVNKNASGRTIRITSKVAMINTYKDAKATDPANAWVAKVTLADDAFTFRGFEVRTTVYADTPYGFLIRGDEAFAKRMDRIPQGRPVVVEGTIRSAIVALIQGGRQGITLSLKDYAIPNLK